MINIIKLISITAILTAPLAGYARDGHDNHQKKEKHCEKTVEGRKVHLEKVKSRKECKQEGGKWVKHSDNHKENDNHDHAKGDSHKH